MHAALWSWEPSQLVAGKRKRWENKEEDETFFNDGGKMEKFWFLRVRVLWEKRKHNYMLLQQTSSLLVLALRLLSSQLLPRNNLLRARAKHWAKSPWCAVKFWQAWALPGGSHPPGNCELTVKRWSWLCKGAPSRLGAFLNHIYGGHKHPETSAPLVWWNWEDAQNFIYLFISLCTLFIASTSGQSMMGWWAGSVHQFACFSDHSEC